MRYIKVFTDFKAALEPLGDAERGRLLMAMLEYADTGAEPDLRGNERFVWPLARLQLDRNEKEYRKQCQNGNKKEHFHRFHRNKHVCYV